MGKKAILINPTLPVWKSNAHHKMIYSAALYATASDFKKAPPKPAPVKVAKTENSQKAEGAKEQKKESGIQRFFKKLFKKKNSGETAKSN
jgi:hypothetical protein